MIEGLPKPFIDSKILNNYNYYPIKKSYFDEEKLNSNHIFQMIEGL